MPVRCRGRRHGHDSSIRIGASTHALELACRERSVIRPMLPHKPPGVPRGDDGLPGPLGLTPGETHDNRLCPGFLAKLRPKTMLHADRGWDADGIRAPVNRQGAWANIPPKRNRTEPIGSSPYLDRA